MPQLDFSSFSSQAFWIIVSFLLMWLIMANFIVPKIVDILNQRQHKIDDYLAAAEQFKQSAEEALEKYEKALKKANEQADENLRAAEEKLKRRIEEKEKQQAKILADLTEKSQQAIEVQRRQTMEQIEKISAELAMVIAQKIGIDDVIIKNDVKAFIEQEQKDG